MEAEMASFKHCDLVYQQLSCLLNCALRSWVWGRGDERMWNEKKAIRKSQSLLFNFINSVSFILIYPAKPARFSLPFSFLLGSFGRLFLVRGGYMIQQPRRVGLIARACRRHGHQKL